MHISSHAFLKVLALTVMLGAGCNRQSPAISSIPAPAPAPTTEPAAETRTLQEQFDAVKQYKDPIGRDDLLIRISQIAAETGDAEITLSAIEAIAHPVMKETAATLAAVKLGKAGKVAEGKAVAELIKDSAKHDEALLELSRLEAAGDTKTE